eukprot:412777_1
MLEDNSHKMSGISSYSSSESEHLSSKRHPAHNFSHPLLVLVIFVILNFFLWFDRGAFSSAQISITDDLHLNSLQYGLIVGLQLLGQSISGPTISHFCEHFPPVMVMLSTLLVVSAMFVLTGFVQTFSTMVLVRIILGICESAFLVYAQALIDSFAPDRRRSIWQAAFLTSIPSGYSAGILFPGQWINACLIGSKWTWRAVFISQGALVLPFTLSLAFIGGPKHMMHLGGDGVDCSKHTMSDISEQRSVCKKLSTLCSNAIYISQVLLFSTQTFVIGAFGVELPTYGQKVYNYSVGRSSAIFGGIALVAGIFGSAAGGIILDSLRKRAKSMNESVRLACLLVMVLNIIGFPCTVAAFSLKIPEISFPLYALATFTIFAQYAPINNAILWVTVPVLQPFAISMMNISTHLLGDSISTPLFGLAIDKMDDNWRLVMFLLSLFLVIPLIISVVCWRLSASHERRCRPLETNENGNDLTKRLIDSDDVESESNDRIIAC